VYRAEYGADLTGADESGDEIVKGVEDGYGIESEVEVERLEGLWLICKVESTESAKTHQISFFWGGNVVVSFSHFFLFSSFTSWYT